MDTMILFLLFSGGLIASFLSLEVRERMYSVILLLIGTLFFGITLLYSQAFIIGLFYLLVYSGLLTVLFASVSNFIEIEERSATNSTQNFKQEEN